jgi:hypothetical protein
MVFFMATIMITYNAILIFGVTSEALLFVIAHAVPAYLVAFVLEWFFVGRIVFKLHGFVVKPRSPKFISIIALALLFVTSMSGLMSFYATLMGLGTGDFWRNFFLAWTVNWPVALLAQLLIAGPIVRHIHSSIFKN